MVVYVETTTFNCFHKHDKLCVGVRAGFATEKDGNCSSAVGEGETIDEEDEDDEDERGAETEEQSGNESEMNEPEEEVSTELHTVGNRRGNHFWSMDPAGMQFL